MCLEYYWRKKILTITRKYAPVNCLLFAGDEDFLCSYIVSTELSEFVTFLFILDDTLLTSYDPSLYYFRRRKVVFYLCLSARRKITQTVTNRFWCFFWTWRGVARELSINSWWQSAGRNRSPGGGLCSAGASGLANDWNDGRHDMRPSPQFPETYEMAAAAAAAVADTRCWQCNEWNVAAMGYNS